MSDHTTDFASAVARCAHCPSLCEPVCPATLGDRARGGTPWGKMALAAALVADSTTASEYDVGWLYHCTACGACRAACTHDTPVSDALDVARRLLATRGLVPAPIRALRAAAEARSGDLAPEGVGLAGSAFLLTGCALRQADPARLGVLARLGELTRESAAARRVPPLIGTVDLCCGLPHKLGGDDAAFDLAVARLDNALQGAALLVVTDQACLEALRDPAAPRLSVPTASLDDYLTRLGVPFPDGARLFGGCRSEPSPRRDPALGAPHWPETAHCCGGAPPYAFVAPDAARGAAREVGRRAVLAHGGPVKLFVPDEACAAHLRKGKVEGLQVLTRADGVGRA